MHLKVVLIDEQEEILNQLTEEIDWATLDCEVVGTAQDGEQGKELLSERKPDIAVSCVVMQGMTGLQMIAAVRDELPECRFIMLSEHDDFEYVRGALRLNVCDYLLKPVQKDEVTEAVRRTVQQIYRQQSANADLRQVGKLRRQAQLLALLTNDSQKGLGVQEMLQGAQMGFEAYYIMVIQLHNQRSYTQTALNTIDSVFEEQQLSAVTILLYDSVVAFVMREQMEGWQEEAITVSEQIVKKMNPNLSIAVSQLQTSRHAIRQAYFQAKQTLWECALGRQNHWPGFYSEYARSGRSPERVAEMHRRINELVEQTDLSDEFAVKAADELFELSGHQYSNLRAIISLYTMALQRKYDVSSDQNVDEALLNTWYVSSAEDARNCLLQLSGALREIEGTPQTSHLIENAIRYINLHAVDGAKLTDVAAKMNVTTNYLSQLIRRETGVSFHEYVLRAKMAVARSMLADPRILIDDVAHAIGYSNYLSFYNAFKRVENMTPTEYRNQHT